MSNINRRYFVYADAHTLYETGLEVASSVEYSPSERKLTVLEKPEGTQQWIVSADREWFISSRKTGLRIIEIPDSAFDEILPTGGIVSEEYSRRFFTEEMMTDFKRIMINIGYGTISDKLL